MSSDKKAKILKAAISLLENTTNTKDVTTRAIAETADVNPAMINYYYGSKDTLLVSAMKSILNDYLSDSGPTPGKNIKEELETLLFDFVEQVLTFKDHLRAAVPKILMDDEIVLSRKVYPYIREYYNGKISDQECRLISYQTVSFILLAMYRLDAVQNYCGIDITDPAQAREFINSEVELILK
ncbi:MAG: TetR/AcrR family transcriptional regulator [Candidatus Methanomethylophilaceae archaeon]|jgi:AcrR family transcriptional regulator